jgi:hypothetical protein
MRTALPWAAALLLLAAPTPGSAAAAGPAGERRPVARIEVPAPKVSPFTLRATLPLPKVVLPRADGRVPLAIEAPDGRRLIPVQLETVSRYPTGETDVVEILARVELPERTVPGRPVRYDVVRVDEGLDPGPDVPPVPREVIDLLDVPGRVRLRGRDAYGNLYEADVLGHDGPGFGSLSWTRRGPVARQRRAYATLVPADAPEDRDKPPLPHLVGVHAYVTEWADEDVVSLDLRVNNGAVSGSRAPTPLEAPLGILYWKSLELVVPRGWSVVPLVRDPFFGPPRAEGDEVVVPIVHPNDDGTLHMMPPQAQFHRRLALVPAGGEEHARETLLNAGLGFCVRDRDNELWSWFNPKTARYFPQRDLLASYDFYKLGDHRGRQAGRVREARGFLDLRQALRTGEPKGYYVTASVMGWAHPWYIRHGYGFGGEGIQTFEGHRVAACASREGYTALELLHRMNACRQPETAYDRFGDVVGYKAWLDDEGRIPFDFRTNGGVVMPPFRLPMSWGAPPSAQVLYVVRNGLRPAYDRGTAYEKNGSVPDEPGNLLAWWPHDDAHMIRYTKHTKALAWLGNDALAKDDLRLSAELFHLMFHESPHVPASWSKGITLRVLEGIAAAHPHQGVAMGRAHAWGIDAMCAAYSLADDEWRAETFEWFRRVGRLCLAAAQPSGLIQRMDNERLFERRYNSTQAFESLFLIHALHCIDESVLRDVDDELRRELEDLAVRGVEYLYWGPPFRREAASWQPDPSHPTIYYQGPANYIAVAPNDGWKTPVFSDASRWGPGYLPPDGLENGIETFHCWQALSYAQEVTDGRSGTGLENRYLRRLLDCWIPHHDFGSLLHDLYDQANDPTYDNSPNWIGLAGKLQCLGVR